MRVTEQELTIEIGEIDRVQVDNYDLAIASANQVLQQFTPNPSSTDYQNARLQERSIDKILEDASEFQTYLLDLAVE